MEQETKKYENVSASERKKYAEELKKIIAKIREDQTKKESPLYGDEPYIEETKKRRKGANKYVPR